MSSSLNERVQCLQTPPKLISKLMNQRTHMYTYMYVEMKSLKKYQDQTYTRMMNMLKRNWVYKLLWAVQLHTILYCYKPRQYCVLSYPNFYNILQFIIINIILFYWKNATYTAHMVLCLSYMQMRRATNLIKTYYAFFKYVFEDNWIYNQINLKGSNIYLINT